jgi:hypothetical protein
VGDVVPIDLGPMGAILFDQPHGTMCDGSAIQGEDERLVVRWKRA